MACRRLRVSLMRYRKTVQYGRDVLSPAASSTPSSTRDHRIFAPPEASIGSLSLSFKSVLMPRHSPCALYSLTY